MIVVEYTTKTTSAEVQQPLGGSTFLLLPKLETLSQATNGMLCGFILFFFFLAMPLCSI